MGDLINRRAAIDLFPDDDLEYDTKGGYVAPHLARQMICELPSAQPEQRWIPCSERLPYAEYGESDNVLATCGYRDVEDGSIRWIKTLYFNGGNWCHPTGETYLEKVYAWMPLPEPYEGGEK